MRDDNDRLLDILEAIAAIQEQAQTRGQFEADIEPLRVAIADIVAERHSKA